MNRDLLIAALIHDERLVLKPYEDSLGILTIGVGHNLTYGISEAAAMFILNEDISAALHLLDTRAPYWRALNDARQEAVANMAFNLGPAFFEFHRLLEALKVRDYERAAAEMLDSRWAQQVGQRAVRLAAIMREGR